MHSVLLLLGSNLGDRDLFIKQAISLIERDIAPVVNKSAVYETQSWGKTDEPEYLNQVLLIETSLSAAEVLEKILAIEKALGRERTAKWGSRTIDIDILFYEQEIINQPGLHIPHPELHKRRFTLEPLAEIVPDWVHPVLNKKILQLKAELSDDLNVKKQYF